MNQARLILLEENGICAVPRQIPLGSAATIGRHPGNDLVLDDPTVSAFHLTVCLHDGHWTVLDRGSCNGTVVSQQRISSTTRLHDGDEIRIGRSRLRFERAWPQPVADEPPPSSLRAPRPTELPSDTTGPDELEGDLDEVLAAFCTGLLDDVPVEQAVLMLPSEQGLAAQACWRCSRRTVAGTARRKLDALLLGQAALLWNDPDPESAAIHVLCPLPFPEGALPGPELGAIWLVCRSVDVEQLRHIMDVSSSLGAFLQQRELLELPTCKLISQARRS